MPDKTLRFETHAEMPARLLWIAAAIATLLLVLFPAISAAAQDDLRDRAEEAFRNDRYPEAIDLYRKILAVSPRDAFSLKRLAMILSWEDRLSESIEVYKRLWAVDPADEEARRELAKIYSWEGRLSESEATYRALLKSHPADTRLKLGLAEVLSWQGKNAEARSIYRRLMESGEERIASAVGLGDVASWEGDFDEAARWYRQVLKADPGNERASVGLARVHHWQGMNRSAVREVEAALRNHPNSRDAKKLQGEIQTSLRPALTPSFDRTIDTDGNDLMAGRITANLHTDPQSTLDVTYARYEADFRCDIAGHCEGFAPAGALATDPIDEIAETEADSIAAVFNTRFSDILYVNGRIGVDRLETFDGRARTGLVGGGSFDLYPTRDFGVGFGYRRESLVDTARLIDNNLRIDAATASVNYAFAKRWRLRGSAQHAWFSDDNRRTVAFASLEVRLPIRRPRLRLTYATRWLSYQEDLDNGYFDPDRFFANLLTLSVGDEFARRKLYYAAEVTGGLQKFRHQVCSVEDPSCPAGKPPLFPDPIPVSSGNDSVFGWNVLGGINFTQRLAFEASYGRTDYAQQTTSGFESHHYGFLLKIVF